MSPAALGSGPAPPRPGMPGRMPSAPAGELYQSPPGRRQGLGSMDQAVAEESENQGPNDRSKRSRSRDEVRWLVGCKVKI